MRLCSLQIVEDSSLETIYTQWVITPNFLVRKLKLSIGGCLALELSGFVIPSIFNGLLPLSSISLLDDYSIGNSQQEILIPHSWEVTALLNNTIPADQKCKDLVKLLSWRCKNKMLDRLEDVRGWQFFKYPQITSHKKRMPRALETESKHNCKVWLFKQYLPLKWKLIA